MTIRRNRVREYGCRTCGEIDAVTISSRRCENVGRERVPVRVNLQVDSGSVLNGDVCFRHVDTGVYSRNNYSRHRGSVEIMLFERTLRFEFGLR